MNQTALEKSTSRRALLTCRALKMSVRKSILRNEKQFDTSILY